MQGHQDTDLAQDGQARGDSAHLLPWPHNAEEKAALAASLEAPASRSIGSRLGTTRSRVAVGAGVIALALTIPDIAVDAMGSPYMRIDVGGNSKQLEMPARSAGHEASAYVNTVPVYAPVIVAEQIAPAALTFSSNSNRLVSVEPAELDFLVSGSERFDLAFAGIEMPEPVRFTVAPALPRQPAGTVRGITPALRTRELRANAIRTRTIDVPQLTSVSGATPIQRVAPEPTTVTVPARAFLTAAGSSDRSAIVANESVAAAFAGTLDVSGDIRSSLPIAPVRQPVIAGSVPSRRPEARSAAPAPVSTPRTDVARVVPVPVPDAAPAVGQNPPLELPAKTQLAARVNGVVTGSVDFRQLDGTIAIRLGSVIDMLRDRFSSEELGQLRAGRAVDRFISLAELQAAGIPIDYDPVYDEVAFGIDYKDAPQAGKVQVEQIGSPTIGTDRTAIDQIPR